MRKLKLFHDFDRLSPADLQRVHDSLLNSTYHKTIAFLRDQFGVVITYGRLQRYYQRWQETQLIKAQSGVTIGVNELISLQNGAALPIPALAHHLIQKAACIQAAQPNQTPARLLSLQRIASHDFNQKMAREKSELEKRKQACREAETVCRIARESRRSASIAQPLQQNFLPASANILKADFQPAQALNFPFDQGHAFFNLKTAVDRG